VCPRRRRGAILSANATWLWFLNEAATAQFSLHYAEINAAAFGGHTPPSQQVACHPAKSGEFSPFKFFCNNKQILTFSKKNLYIYRNRRFLNFFCLFEIEDWIGKRGVPPSPHPPKEKGEHQKNLKVS